MLSWSCYNTHICICYITLLNMLINKLTTVFFWRKSAEDTGSFENGNSFQKKMAYMILCIL